MTRFRRKTHETTPAAVCVVVGAATWLLVILKLVGAINWSWWWVLAPAWVSALVFAVLILATVAIFYIQYREG